MAALAQLQLPASHAEGGGGAGLACEVAVHVQLPDGGMPVKVSTAPDPTCLSLAAGAGLACRLLCMFSCLRDVLLCTDLMFSVV